MWKIQAVPSLYQHEAVSMRLWVLCLLQELLPLSSCLERKGAHDIWKLGRGFLCPESAFWKDDPVHPSPVLARLSCPLKVLMSSCSKIQELWFILQCSVPVQTMLQNPGFPLCTKGFGQNKARMSKVMSSYTLLAKEWETKAKQRLAVQSFADCGKWCCQGDDLALDRRSWC